MPILFDDGVLRVVIRRHADRTRPLRGTLVTFADLTFRPDEEKLWGEAPAAALGYDLIGIVAHTENWFPLASMKRAARVVRGRLRTPALGYGYSMGGYGVLKYGRLLGLEHVLAVCPQFSIDPEDVPADDRFHAHFDPGLHRAMAIRPRDLARFAVQIADPYHPEDNLNAAAIDALGRSHWVRTPFLGHAAIWMLTEHAFLGRLFERVLEEDTAGLRRLMRERRAQTPHWLRNVGRAAMERGRAERAMRLWDRSEELGMHAKVRADDYAELLPGLIRRRFQQKRGGEALALLDAVAPRIEKHALGRERIGHALAGENLWPLALEHFEAASRINPAQAGAWRGVIASLNALGRPEEAMAAAERAHAALPENGEIALTLGRGFLHGGDAARAEPLLRLAAAAMPEEPLALQSLAEALGRLGRKAEAKALLHQTRASLASRPRPAQALRPLEARMHRGLARALLMAGDRRAALEAAREAYRLNPEGKANIALLLRCHLARGQVLRALALLPRLLRARD